MHVSQSDALRVESVGLNHVAHFVQLRHSHFE